MATANGQVEVSIGGNTTLYASFDEAWREATANDSDTFTIKLLANANTPGVELPTGKTCIFDLNGCTLTQDSGTGSSSSAIFKVGTNAHLIIEDNSEDGSGIITSTITYQGNVFGQAEPTSGAIKVLGKGSSFTLNGGTITGIQVTDGMQHSVVYVKNGTGESN